jgi:hypothetical protein
MAGIIQHIENWRAIDGYINYEISSHGRVRNITTTRILKAGIDGPGYYHVGLYKDGKMKTQKIHRLVSFAYCENPNDYNVVDHIDKNRLNNMYNNLRWCTLSENQRNTTISKNNVSGKQGVCFNESNNRWIASWHNNNLKQKSKSFSVNKYGADQAKQLAIDYRKTMEIECNYT